MIEQPDRNPLPDSINLTYLNREMAPHSETPHKKIQKGAHPNRRRLSPPIRSAMLALPLILGPLAGAGQALSAEYPMQLMETSSKPSYDPACEKEFLNRVQKFRESKGENLSAQDLEAYRAFAHMFLYGKPLGYPDNAGIEFNPTIGAFEVFINNIDDLPDFYKSKKEVVRWFLEYNLKTDNSQDHFLSPEGLKKIPFEFILKQSQFSKIPAGTRLNSLPDDSCPTAPGGNNEKK